MPEGCFIDTDEIPDELLGRDDSDARERVLEAQQRLAAMETASLFESNELRHE